MRSILGGSSRSCRSAAGPPLTSGKCHAVKGVDGSTGMDPARHVALSGERKGCLSFAQMQPLIQTAGMDAGKPGERDGLPSGSHQRRCCGPAHAPPAVCGCAQRCAAGGGRLLACCLPWARGHAVCHGLCAPLCLHVGLASMPVMLLVRPLPLQQASKILCNTFSCCWHYQMSTGRVITMEWVDGCKVNNAEQLLAQQLRPREVALLMLHTFAEMTFVLGFTHGDPHPVRACMPAFLLWAPFWQANPPRLGSAHQLSVKKSVCAQGNIIVRPCPQSSGVAPLPLVAMG